VFVLSKKLFLPVDSSILSFFRICFSIVILIELSTIESYFIDNLSKQEFHFKYDFLEWLPVLSSYQFSLLFVAAKILCVFMCLGLFYRLNSILLFITWSYIFFCERGHYNNHFYFYSITLFYFCIVDGNKYFSLRFKKSKEKNTPYWQLFIFQLQIFIVYFYGGIAKLNADWLSGFPMVYWLPPQVEFFPEFLRKFLSSHNGALFISYIGLIFDLSIGFLLFSNRFRYLSWVFIITFNIMNHFIWNIGTFPWAMIAATFLFYNPAWPKDFITSVKNKKIKIHGIKKLIKSLYSPDARKIFESEKTMAFKKPVLVFLMLFFVIQFLVPLRHWLYKGDVAWTGEGHLFSWRMMLTSSDDAVRIKMTFPNDTNTYYVDMFAYMNRGQLNKITKTPKMIIKFTQFLKNNVYKKTGITNINIHLEMYKSVNYRTPQLLNDTTLNYANIEYSYFNSAEWILPNKLSTSDLRSGLKNDSHWENILY